MSEDAMPGYRRAPLPERAHRGSPTHHHANYLFTGLDMRSAPLPSVRARSQSALIMNARCGEASRAVYERITHFGGVPCKVMANPYGYTLILRMHTGEQVVVDLLEDIRQLTIS
jgi:hypothetical protein